MKILKKGKTQSRQVVQPRMSAPVVRYYRPQNTPATRIDGSSSNSVKRQSFTVKAFRFGSRWCGIVAIVLLLIANTGITSSGVQIVDQNQNYRTNEAYKQIVQEILDSSVFNKNKLTLNSSSFERQLFDRFPEVSGASVVIPLAGRKLQVTLQLAHPLARLIAGGNQQAVVSDTGVVVRLASAESINATFRDLPALSMPNVSTRGGQQILTGTETRLIKLLLSEFDGATSLRPKAESIEFDVLKREIRARFNGMQYYAKLTPEREARGQVGALVAAIQDFSEKNISINEYIDVRVDGRVFIR